MNMRTAPESITGETIVARARDIATRLTARGEAAEKAGRLPDETIEEVTRAGLMRIATPKAYGGLELDYRFIPEASRALAHGCLATAWTIGILIPHNWQIGLFPKEAQDEVFANGPDVFAPGYIVPGGVARRVDGGWRLSGHWRMGSGYPHGQWILLSAHEIVDGEKGPLRRFVLPIGDCTGVNNWAVSGISASGTWDCTLDDVFAPDHRSMPASSMLNGTAPGLSVNKGPLFRIPMLSLYYPNLAAMVLGAAEGVMALILARASERHLSYGGAKASELGYTQINIGREMTQLNACGAFLASESARIMRTAESGGEFSKVDRAAVRSNCTWIVKQARATAAQACDEAGTSVFFLHSPLQRFLREIQIMSSHAFYDFDRMAGVYGRTLLGGDVPEGELV